MNDKTVEAMETITISQFVRRQTVESPYTHFEGSDQQLLDRVTEVFKTREETKVKQGYREGVLLVQVDPKGFFTGVVELKSGDNLVGTYVPRVEGEKPRKHIGVRKDREKQPAKLVEIVLYHHDVLAETNDNSDSDWEIISINGHPTDEPAPIDPRTLMYNHFECSGGTKTNMSSQEFESALRESFLYWKDKGMLK